ncbi:MAG TPA: polysaccharide deacetylase family protein [Vicinamibacterales bacterium]|nr:polysaccharide deacetylase family protein [Vicinamibacterales bacterium]
MRSTVGAAIPRRLATRRLRAGAVSTSSVLLTFDDGPSETVTPAVLDRLETHNARAVFFIIGNRAERCLGLLREISARGHLLGNHSYTHADTYFEPHKPPPLGPFRADVARCQAMLDPVIGRGPRLYRPPGGRLTVSTMLTAQLLRLQCIVWSREVSDWSFRRDDEARAGASRLVREIQPGDIVLLHDDNPRLLTLLDVLLPGLASRGLDLSSGARYL